jgi:hypothetical protein
VPKLADEIALVSKLRSLGAECNAFDGLTTIEQRKEAILKAMDTFEGVTYTVRNGKRITMAMQFADVYGEVPEW